MSYLQYPLETPSGFNKGIILKTNRFLSSNDWSFWSRRKVKMPLSTWEAGTSPGWTRHVKKIVGLLNLKGLSFEYKSYLSFGGQGKSPLSHDSWVLVMCW